MVVILPYPFSAARPMLLLPDRGPALQLIDHVASRGEGVHPVRGGNGHSDRGLTHIERPDAVDRSHAVQRPLAMRLVDDLLDLGLDVAAVGLVLEMGHPIASRGVIPHGSEEQDDGPAVGSGHRLDEGRHVDRIGRDGHEVLAPGYRVGRHTIPSVEHPTHGYDADAPSVSDTANEPTVHDPRREPVSGLDYTFSAPEPQPERVIVERASPLPMGIIAFLSAMVGALLTVAILSFAGFFDTETVAAPTTTVPTVTTTTVSASPTIVSPVTDAEMRQAVWAKVNPSVVTVQVGNESAGELEIDGSGSGVALPNGYIVTNHHVIEGSEVAQIVLQDGRIYDAEIVGSDAYTDLAVLRAEAAGLIPIEIGDVDDLAIGQVAIAVGNPLGQLGGSSLTVGVLSALSRRVDFEDGDRLFGMLQTDAPITNGSSGGALVDDEGRLIGITSAIGLSEAGAEGIGYAIPVDVVRRITDELIETGAVRHAYLGIVGDNHVETAEDGAFVPSGAVIKVIDPPDGAAGRAGLEVDDVIVEMEGVGVSTMSELVLQLGLYRVGDTIEIVVLRDGERIMVPVTLDERPEGLT